MARSDPHIIASLPCHSCFLFRGEYKEQKEKAVSARDNVQAKKDTQTIWFCQGAWVSYFFCQTNAT